MNKPPFPENRIFDDHDRRVWKIVFWVLLGFVVLGPPAVKVFMLLAGLYGEYVVLWFPDLR